VTLFILSVSIALVISFFCSLAEATLLSLTPAQIAKMADVNRMQADIWQRFKRNIDRPISVILLLNTTAHTIGAAVAGAQFDEIYGDEWILAFSLILTFLMLQYTEIAPKTLGVRHNFKIALAIGTPINVLVKVLEPILKLLHFLNRPFSRGEKPSNQVATIAELNSMASFARLSNVISTDEEKIIHNVPKLSSLRADQLMIPVEQVIFFRAEFTIQEALAKAQVDPHTRFPVFANESKDDIVGYLNFKEMIFNQESVGPSARIQPIRPVQFIPPNMSARDLLRLFVNEHIHMAIVKDKNKTLGMITVEDVIEEMLGDLQDEFDKLPRMYQQVSANVWMVGGGLSVKELNDKLGTTMDDEKKLVSSWLISKMGRVPSSGESIKLAGKNFQIRRTRRGKVFEVMITEDLPIVRGIST